MRLNENPLMIVVGIALLLVGFLSFLNFRIFPTNMVMTIAVFAIAVLILVVVFTGRVKSNVGLIVFAIWLALMGVMSYFRLVFSYSDLLLSILPVGAGLFLIIGM